MTHHVAFATAEMPHIRGYEEGNFVLIVGAQQFCADKAILRDRSPYFRNLISQSSNNNELKITETSLPFEFYRDWVTYLVQGSIAYDNLPMDSGTLSIEQILQFYIRADNAHEMAKIARSDGMRELWAKALYQQDSREEKFKELRLEEFDHDQLLFLMYHFRNDWEKISVRAKVAGVVFILEANTLEALCQCTALKALEFVRIELRQGGEMVVRKHCHAQYVAVDSFFPGYYVLRIIQSNPNLQSLSFSQKLGCDVLNFAKYLAINTPHLKTLSLEDDSLEPDNAFFKDITENCSELESFTVCGRSISPT